MKQSLIIFFKEILASINHREQQRTVPHGNDLPSQASSPGLGAYQQFLVHKQSVSTKFLPWSVPCLHHSELPSLSTKYGKAYKETVSHKFPICL